MTWPELWQYTFLGMSIVELLAVGLGLLSVWLTVRENIWCWPIGAGMVALYACVFFHARLYADTGLQVIYFALQFYGWYQWLHGGQDREQLRIGRIRRRVLLGLLAGGAAGSVALGYCLQRWTNQEVSYLDSTITVFSLVAQWMLARKLLENWLFWIAIDVLAVGVYCYKALYPTGVLYALFLGMAISGYLQWRRTWRSESVPAVAMPSAMAEAA